MREVRNNDGSLVAVIEEDTGTVIIIRRGCETRLYLSENGEIVIQNV